MNALAEFTHKCSRWNDEYLLEQLARGPSGYANNAFFEAIQAEANQRGLDAELPHALPMLAPDPEPIAAPIAGPILERLWRGHVPLWQAYWIWGAGGNALWFVLVFVAAGIEPMVAYLLAWISVGYFFFVAIGIWRSAGRYTGPSHWAVLARIGVGLGIARTVMNLVGGY